MRAIVTTTCTGCGCVTCRAVCFFNFANHADHVDILVYVRLILLLSGSKDLAKVPFFVVKASALAPAMVAVAFYYLRIRKRTNNRQQGKQNKASQYSTDCEYNAKCAQEIF